MKLKTLIAATVLMAGAAHAGTNDGKYDYLMNECKARYEAIWNATGSQPLAANFQAACGLGLMAGIDGDTKAQREQAEVVAKYAKDAETGMGDIMAITNVALANLFLHEYERGYQVAHGQ